MSTYYAYTKHPKTARWENACWIDDHYGRHRYGVRFPDGDTFDPDKVRLQCHVTEKEAEILNKALENGR